MSQIAESIEASGVRGKLEHLMGGVKDRAETFKKRSIEDLWTGTRDYVKDNPGKTILVSLGLGVLVGSLIRRR